MVTDLPKYMNDVLKFSIKENGFYNALPYLAMFIVAQLTGFVSDFIITRGYMSITNVRKFFTILGEWPVNCCVKTKHRINLIVCVLFGEISKALCFVKISLVAGRKQRHNYDTVY